MSIFNETVEKFGFQLDLGVDGASRKASGLIKENPLKGVDEQLCHDNIIA